MTDAFFVICLLAMEDAHAAVVPLDDGAENSNAFFAVYDGHGGAFPIWVSFGRPSITYLVIHQVTQ
jgi:hypothetical protein